MLIQNVIKSSLAGCRYKKDSTDATNKVKEVKEAKKCGIIKKYAELVFLEKQVNDPYNFRSDRHNYSLYVD